MNDTLKTIHSLRSIHGNFSDRAVPDEELQTILQACVRAANASARQSYSIVVIDDREMMKQLCGYAGSRGLLFCVDYTRLVAQANHLGHPFKAGGTTAFVTGSIDTILAAQTAAIAAKSLGIDSLFTNGIHRGDIQRVYRLLGLPEKYCFPLIMLILGYPAEEPSFQKGRLSGPAIIHYGQYHSLTPDELAALVQEYDDPERHLGLTEAWREKGFAHYLDWFYTTWVGAPPKTDAKSQLAEILEQRGFGYP